MFFLPFTFSLVITKNSLRGGKILQRLSDFSWVELLIYTFFFNSLKKLNIFLNNLTLNYFLGSILILVILLLIV